MAINNGSPNSLETATSHLAPDTSINALPDDSSTNPLNWSEDDDADNVDLDPTPRTSPPLESTPLHDERRDAVDFSLLPDDSLIHDLASITASDVSSIDPHFPYIFPPAVFGVAPPPFAVLRLDGQVRDTWTADIPDLGGYTWEGGMYHSDPRTRQFPGTTRDFRWEDDDFVIIVQTAIVPLPSRWFYFRRGTTTFLGIMPPGRAHIPIRLDTV